MAVGKYSRIDGKKSWSSYCSRGTVIVFVALCLVGVWMITSSSSLGPLQSSDVPSQEKDNEVNTKVGENSANNDGAITTENNPMQSLDKPGDLTQDATKEENAVSSSKDEGNSKTKVDDNSANSDSTPTTGSNPKQFEANHTDQPGDATKGENKVSSNQGKDNSNSQENLEAKEENKEMPDTPKVEMENRDDRKQDGESKGQDINNEAMDIESTVNESNPHGKGDFTQGSNQNKSESNASKQKQQENLDEKKDNQTGREVEKKQGEGSEQSKDKQAKGQTSNNLFPSGIQLEILNETSTQNGSFSTQAALSKNEKELQQSSAQQTTYNWKLCNATAGPDYIPCLDNVYAIKHLPSTKHYEHRERHCPDNPPTCLVPLPEGYQRPIEWPTSRERIWYHNVPHTGLAQYKGHQNWVKVSGEYLTFPGGGTQFKHGAQHYIDFIQQSVPEITWGKRSRVILDVGCGVASFGGYLFDKDVLAMSLAPKDEHEAQVQFALERGIPAISAVMGTKRLPFPGRVFDVIHCARCRVPWHIEGGKLLLELNRILRPGGFFVWSATPIYKKGPEDVQIWEAMKKLTKSMCWEVVSITKDRVNGVGIAIYRKPTFNECYEKRSQNEPPLCQELDDPNAAWYVLLQECMHKLQVDAKERGSQWPEQWPARLEKPPYWLLSSQVGVYGKAAPEDFTVDYQHWTHVVTKSYLNGLGINWLNVRNAMDMRAVYGGFAAALKNLNVWVMNVVSIEAPDTLPIIYERGLFGIYHDWCESFSTYPRSYDLLHADHLFSKIKTRCGILPLVAESDRILRPLGKIIIRDNVETINELESMLKYLHWDIQMTYTKDREGLLCAQKSMWRPTEWDNLSYALNLTSTHV